MSTQDMVHVSRGKDGRGPYKRARPKPPEVKHATASQNLASRGSSADPFEEGKPMKSRKNPDGSESGFVSADAQVGPDVHIDSDSSVKGAATITGKTEIRGSVIDGEPTIHSSVIENSTVSGTPNISDSNISSSSVFGEPSVKDSIVERGSSVFDRADVEGAFVSENSRVFGQAEVSGKVVNQSNVLGWAIVEKGATVSDETLTLGGAHVGAGSYVQESVLSDECVVNQTSVEGAFIYGNAELEGCSVGRNEHIGEGRYDRQTIGEQFGI